MNGLNFFLFFAFLFPILASADQYKNSTRVIHEGMYLYNYRGDAFEIGEAVAKLSPVGFDTEGLIPYMKDYVAKFTGAQELIQKNGFLRAVLPAFLDIKYYNLLKQKVGPEEKDFITGMARSSKLSKNNIFRAMVNPDLVTLIIDDAVSGTLFKGFKKTYKEELNLITPPVAVAPQDFKAHPSLACTAFAVPATESATGNLIFGRVQDYAGGNTFNAFKSVHLVEQKNRYAYVSIMSDGVATGAITGMNEHGLVLTVNIGVSTKTNVHGTPLMKFSRTILQNAKTIEEAHEVCKLNVPMGSWIVSLADKNQAARLEFNPLRKKCFLHTFKDERMANTNHFTTEELKEFEISGGKLSDLSSRSRRNEALRLMDEYIRADNGKISIRNALRILGSRFDPILNRYLGYAPNGVAAPDQIKAVLFSPATKEIWVSNGDSPPGSRGKFLHFDFDDLRNLANIEDRGRNQDYSIEDLHRNTGDNLKLYAGFEDYLKSTFYLEVTGDFNPARGLHYLNRAVSLEADEPLLKFVRAMTNLRLGNFLDAESDLISIRDSKLLDQYRNGLVHLWLAKTADAKGQRQKALQLYYEIMAGPFLYIKEGARKYIQKPFSKQKLKYLVPDWKNFDAPI